MASFVMNNASVVIDSVDLSDHCRSVTLDWGAEMVPDGVMGDTVTSSIAGMLTPSLTVELVQDYASSSVDVTLFALVGAAKFTVVVKADAGTTTATNPSFSSSYVLESYNPVAGSLGELAMCSASFAAAGVTLTRATT